MSEQIEACEPRIQSRRGWLPTAGILAVAVAAAAFPSQTWETAVFVANGLWVVAPLVIPGILISAWVTASGAGGRIANAFEGRLVRTILMASAIGAITPVCGVTVLPLMASLLSSGVPLAPVMAFWLSSPITDPAMLATTAATLGWGFAIAKSIAAFGLGLLGGAVTAVLSGRPWTQNPLRQNGLVANLGGGACACDQPFHAQIWQSDQRRRQFAQEVYAMTRFIIIVLVPAFAAEHLLNELLNPAALAAYVGAQTWWGIPLAVLVGAPAYIDGRAALPLTRGLMDHGMSPGAALAFLVSGGVVSIWGAMAIAPVLRTRAFLLYLALAVLGSLIAGWSYALIA